MDSETIVAASRMTPSELVMFILFLGAMVTAAYFIKKYKLEKIMKEVFCKFALLELSAEKNIKGEKMGEERMRAVERAIEFPMSSPLVGVTEEVFTSEEMEVVERMGGVRKVANAVFGVVKYLLPLILTKGTIISGKGK